MTPTIERILFPTDFSPCAEGAYRHAAYLADRFGAELHVLHVVEDEGTPERAWPEAPGTGHLRITMADVCEDLGLPAPSSDADHDPLDLVEVVETEVVGRNVPEAILDYVRDEAVDLVVVGTHGRTGWRRGVLGSVAETTLRRAPCPVLTVRPLDAPGDGPWPPSRILLALDDVPADGFGKAQVPASAGWAARLAVAYRVPLDVIHVETPAVGIPNPILEADERTRLREALGSLAELLRARTDANLPVTVAVRVGDPVTEVRALAEAGRAHLLVVGSHSRQGPGRALLGSVAEALVRTAPCPVLVAPDTRDEPVRARTHAVPRVQA